MRKLFLSEEIADEEVDNIEDAIKILEESEQ